MEFISEAYKRCIGNVIASIDGYKYFQSKVTDKYVYLKCAIFRSGCKGTSKIDRARNLLVPMKEHNHGVDDYKSDIYKLKTKCKTMAKQVETTGLREIFDDVTRNDLCARDVSFPECESSMYRARRKTHPKLPLTASEFVDMLPTTSLGVHFKFSVRCEDQVGVVFFSDEIRSILSEVTNIQFDGTFYTVPVQFYQLWTIFIAVGRHTLPAIHCLLSAKTQGLYKTVLDNIIIHIPQLKPKASMSDWEPAARNAFKEIFPEIINYGCLFHYTQRIWAKTQKLGLTDAFKNNPEIARFIRQLMAIPFLPASLIYPTYSLIPTPTLENTEAVKLTKLKKYVKKHWLIQTPPEELSIYELNIATNNGAESYHSKLKARIRTSHPRIWTFMSYINEIILDVDNDIGRFRSGKEITRTRKTTSVRNEEQRASLKHKLSVGEFTPWQFLQAISHTIGSVQIQHSEISEPEDSEDDHEEQYANNPDHLCVVCLLPRTTTWIFMPCRHANFCSDCSHQVIELEQQCPICRSDIESLFEIFTD